MTELLEIEELHREVKDAGAAKRILAPITRRFAPGRMAVVGGPSGAGKTTLLSLISLAVRPSGGRIRHRGIELTALVDAEAARWRRTQLGMIFQTSRLVGVMTAREHIELTVRLRASGAGGEAAATRAAGMELLAAMGLNDRLDHRPVRLSGGEKQRVALAQALCFGPSVVLADEPTAALDAPNARLIGETLHHYARARSAIVLCVSHDKALRALADDAFDLEKP